MKILLVDDNKSTTKMMSTFMNAQPENYQVGIANNGLQALEYYPKFKPDFVVLDISMPGMDGIETLSRIFKIDKDANVCMATASDAKRTIDICLQKGALAYISKPYSPEELLSTIKNALNGGMYKRDLTTFFSRIANKMEGNILKMIGRNNLSIIFKDVSIIPHKSEMRTANYTSSIKRTSDIEEIKVFVPNKCAGFSTEIGGQNDGTVISVIDKKQLRRVLTGDESGQELEDEDTAVLELFNIINSNIISQLADVMNIKLDSLPVRLYVSDKDSIVKNKDLVKTTFDISLNGTVITSLEIYLWFNMSGLYHNLF